MINTVSGIRSTGRICSNIASELIKQGHDVVIAYGRGRVPKECEKYSFKIGTSVSVFFHILKSRLFDKSGFGSTKATRKFVTWIKRYNPDVIHLHNLHGYYLNVPILFNYLQNCGKTIIWTLHDCWPFTGHCCYFTAYNCEKWKTKCFSCPLKRDYPRSIIADKSQSNYFRKKELFERMINYTIVTPSKWLSELVKQSFLKNANVRIINNGVDLNVFKKTDVDLSKYGVDTSKRIILGIASVWDKRKGLNDFIELNSKIDKTKYQIVLVGVDKKQARIIPNNVVCIEHTDNINELAGLYSTASVLFNPTYEDNYPTVNLESIACGTPVVTYATGGSPEIINQCGFGLVIEKRDFNKLLSFIDDFDKVAFSKPFDLQTISKNQMVSNYLTLYQFVLANDKREESHE